MTYIVADQVEGEAVLYGAARDFWRYKGAEAILSGPYDTGKTFGALHKLHALNLKYANSFSFMARLTYKSLKNTVIKTYENKILPVPPKHPDSAIRKHGGENVEFYEYPNGSQIICAGLDDPYKLLSGEFDFGYVNQAEEVPLNAWEILSGRLSGRAGNAPYTQLMADCNPSYPTHWILHRKRLKLFEQLHRYNPTIYNQATGELLPEGAKRIETLQGLTGLRYKQGYLGLWESAEGTVYEFMSATHRIPRDKLPEIRAWYLAIDFGFTNPFVCQLWGLDSDGRLYLVNEIYMTRRTIEEHIPKIKELIGNRRIEACVTDHDPGAQKTLTQHGIPNVINAKKDIENGIQIMQNRLKVQADKKPRLFVVEDACIEWDSNLFREYPGDLFPCCTEHEFPLYAYPETKEGKPEKETPLDVNNHGMDASRYMTMYFENQPRSEIINVPNIFGRFT